MMETERIQSLITEKFPGLAVKAVKGSILLDNPKDLPRILSFLREHPETKLDYLSMISAGDYLSYLESVYYLYSVEKKHGPVVFRVRVPRDNPRIPSLVSVYRGANLQEREAYDMFGIVYENHPDLRRLFFWEEFEGYSLRKDYLPEDPDVLEEVDIKWLQNHGIDTPPKFLNEAAELKRQGLRALAKKPRREADR